MVQTIVSYLPQLVHSTTHQSAPSAAPLQTESPAAPNQGVPPEVEPPQPQVVEARAASPTPTPARSKSRSYNPIPTEPDFDTLSTDTADSLREQVRRVHQRLDEVQKEVLKSRGEVGESSKGGSPFTPEIQAKQLPATFMLPALEIFFQIRERGLLKAPSPMKSHPERRNKRRYYRFHWEYGHDTEEYHDLQYQIEDLIRRGHLRRYVCE
ncbi:hypothetical protein BHM03_00008593 [Ensete ventricosum]|nr:hypothetical protein BHM03_00008593 [Ensete ventricosum]